MSEKFKHAKILQDYGHLEKDLDLKIPINASEANPPRRLSRQLTEVESSPTGSKSARNKTEIDPILVENLFASEGNTN
jgi:hypothetical protein